MRRRHPGRAGEDTARTARRVEPSWPRRASMLGFVLAVTLPLAVALPARAVNRCTIDGRLVFQDRPCPTGTGGAIAVKPATGRGGATPAPDLDPAIGPAGAAAASAPPATEAQRLQARIAASRRDSRKFLLEVRLVPDAAAAIDAHQRRCDAELAALRAGKSRAADNLAGATWEHAISSEMNAVALRCDTRSRELRVRYDALRDECAALGGC